MIHQYLFKYAKEGPLVYISHLDLLRLLGRAARRADLPVVLTQGFHPRLRLKLHQALKLGLEAQDQTGEIVLKDRWVDCDIQKRWQRELPDGIVIQECRFMRSI